MRIVLMVHLYGQLTRADGVGARFVKDYGRTVAPPPGVEFTEVVWDDEVKEPVRTIYSSESDTLVYYFDDYAGSDDDYAEEAIKAYVAAGWESMDDVSFGYPMPHPRGYVSLAAASDAEWMLIAPRLIV
jgi:hypothetical protein